MLTLQPYTWRGSKTVIYRQFECLFFCQNKVTGYWNTASQLCWWDDIGNLFRDYGGVFDTFRRSLGFRFYVSQLFHTQMQPPKHTKCIACSTTSERKWEWSIGVLTGLICSKQIECHCTDYSLFNTPNTTQYYIKHSNDKCNEKIHTQIRTKTNS